VCVLRQVEFDVVRRFFQSFDQHHLQEMLMACTEDARVRFVPMGEQGDGRVRVLGAGFWSALFKAVPDLHVIQRSIFGDRRTVTAEVILGGTQRKEFEQIPSRGKHFELPHAFLIELNDNVKISSITAYWDNVTLFSELGKTTL
jgi:steroid delta-isomerase-like uncharacterized protein